MARGTVVRSQMPAMRAKTSTRGRQCAAPFDRAHDTGNGGIPVHTYEDLGEKAAKTVSAALADAVGGNNRQPGPAAKRFPFGGSQRR